MNDRSTSSGRPAALAITAGLAMGLTAASTASAVSDVRLALRWGDWQVIGILGSETVIGSLDGGQPNVNHDSFKDAEIVQIAYPLPVQVADLTFFRKDFVTPHATAVLGAIGARNTQVGGVSDFGGIIGFAPQSKLITGSIAAGLDTFSGSFIGASNEAFAFALLAMTDQAFADSVWQPLGLPERYRVATVVNMAFGNPRGKEQTFGNDAFAQIADVVATRNRVTLVGAGGNSDTDPTLENTMGPDFGSMASPASALNVIAVGFTEPGRTGSVVEESSRGPQATADMRAEGRYALFDFSSDLFLDGPPPNEPDAVSSRNGVDIVAPAVELSLPGSPAGSPFDNTNFSSAWAGSSFSSAIVTGAIGLLHDLHRKRYFAENPDALDEFDPNAVLSPLVTKAILYNSANKESDWDNNAQVSSDEGDLNGALVTSTPFDTDSGAGRLDMRRLRNQYLATPGLGGYRDLTGATVDALGNPLVVAFVRNPRITDPTDERLNAAPNLNIAIDPNIEELQDYVQRDEVGFPLRVPGTDPTRAAFHRFRDPDSGSVDRSAARPVMPKAPIAQGSSTPHYQPRGLVHMQFQLEPPGDSDGGLETPGSGGTGTSGGPGLNTTTGDGGLTGGLNTGGAGGGDFFSSGWDHGMIGKGSLDLPIGLISEGSDITATVVWQRRLSLDERVIDALAASILPPPPPVQSTEEFIPGGSFRPGPLRNAPRSAFEGDPAASDATAEPTVMAGVRIPANAVDPPLPPAESDTPTDRIDPNDADSPFNGVCFIEIASTGRRFTGVAIGPRHIITAAHPFDPGNIGALDATNPGSVRVVFNGVPRDDGAGGTAFLPLVFNQGSVQRIDIVPTYIGIGLTPSGQNRGFANDLAVLTLREDAAGFTDLNLFNEGVFTYPVWLAPVSEGTEVVIVGYGETGQGDLGFDASIPINSATKRVGANILDEPFARSYEYDFDGPGIPFLDGAFAESLSIGNRNFSANPPQVAPSGLGETIHAEGDSGSPAFIWFDSDNDGLIQPAELRLYGVNTYRRIGNAQVMGGFGTTGGGQVLNFFADFIDGALNPPPPEEPGFITERIFYEEERTALSNLRAFEFQKLNLELWRFSFDGAGNRLVATSTSEWETTELIHVDDDDLVPTGTYFLRIVYEGTQWDFGGFRFTGINSEEVFNQFGDGFEDFFDGDVEYGLAWYVDLERDRNIFPTRSVKSPEDFMGDMTGDGYIDGADLGALLTLWGTPPESGRGDLNADGVVDSADLAIQLRNYTGSKESFLASLDE